jgi:hypothetical protein
MAVNVWCGLIGAFQSGYDQLAFFCSFAGGYPVSDRRPQYLHNDIIGRSRQRYVQLLGDCLHKPAAVGFMSFLLSLTYRDHTSSICHTYLSVKL